jgi:REP element-mobilizing transposase RayT
MSGYPDRPPRLRQIFQQYDPPLYFVTFGTAERHCCLANEVIHQQFMDFGKRLSQHGSSIGRYVIMPDHIHCFVRIGPSQKFGLTIGFLKKSLSASLNKNGVNGPHWQPSFFDHLIRSPDSYSEKWDYVYNNPVRAGLVKQAEDWPFSGEIVQISY